MRDLFLGEMGAYPFFSSIDSATSSFASVVEGRSTAVVGRGEDSRGERWS